MPQISSLAVQPRSLEETNKVLRRKGVVPAVIYGRHFEPKSVQLDYTVAERTVRQAGMSRLLSLTVDGDDEQHTVLIRDVAREPVSGRILHMDIYRVLAGEEIRNHVPIITIGVAPVVETMGATVSHTLDTIEVQCLPKDMPESFVVDLSGIVDLTARITVADLQVPANVTILTEPDMEVVQIIAARLVEEEEEEETLYGVVGEAAEGEAAEDQAGEESAEDDE